MHASVTCLKSARYESGEGTFQKSVTEKGLMQKSQTLKDHSLGFSTFLITRCKAAHAGLQKRQSWLSKLKNGSLKNLILHTSMVKYSLFMDFCLCFKYFLTQSI